MKHLLTILFAAASISASAQNYVSKVWCPDNGDGTFTNPVINADYSDPDVCVGASGEDFYLTASSFNCIPGLPILHSKDLVNWRIVNHAIKTLLPEERYNVPQHGNGVWAPSIRYNPYNATYYIYWGDPDLGVFVVTAKDPEGEWTAPRCVIAGKGMIDTTPLWDEDGRCYLVNGWANSRAGINSQLTVREMSADGMEEIGRPVMVFDGNGTENFTAEGPKFYKRDGWYWIMCPAGGVPVGHQLAMRSKSPFGPYEHKIVLARGTTDINGPHQGGWVHLKSGEDWFLHFQDKEAYGRVVWLEPVTWKDNWPVMGEKAKNYCGQPVLKYKKPNVGRDYPVENPVESDEFNTSELGKQWQWHANYQQMFGMPTPFGVFRLFCHEQSADFKNMWEAGNLLLQKTPADNFTVTTKVRLSAKNDGQYGGLTVFGMDYSALVLRRVGDKFELQQITCKQADKGKPETVTTLATLQATEKDKINYHPAIHCDGYLRLKVTYLGGVNADGTNKHEAQVTFFWSKDGRKFQPVGESFTMRQGKWIGAKIGLMAAELPGKQDRGWIDVDWFRVE